MRPEISLVLLTILSGVGQGLFIFITALYIASQVGVEISNNLLILMTLISLFFSGLGAVASFFHLGHPSRGWKAIKNFKHSWLSREVVFLPLFVGLAFMFLLGLIVDVSPIFLLSIALLASGASIGLYVSSAMLYAAINFIKEWSNPLTVFNFVLFGITSGSAIGFVLILFQSSNDDLIAGALFFMIVVSGMSLLMKLLNFWRNDNMYNPWSLKNALGINAPKIKIQDKGCAYETYNSHEFYFPLDEKEKGKKKLLVLLVGFILPLLSLVLIAHNLGSSMIGFIALCGAVLNLVGLFIERKLFFVQGNHVQNLYYGNFPTNTVINPLVVSGRK